jgi:hypothetical protein
VLQGPADSAVVLDPKAKQGKQCSVYAGSERFRKGNMSKFVSSS